MNPRFFDCVIAKKNNLCFNFFEDYLYLNSISKRLGYRKFIALDGLEGKKDQVVPSTSPSASSFSDALKIASYALSFFTLLIIAVIVKAINRYYCHSYKMIKANPIAHFTFNMTPQTIQTSTPSPSVTKQSDDDVAIYNQYLDFIQNFSLSKKDVFLLQIQYDSLSKKFPDYNSCENKELRSKINNLKNLYQEKIESLCLAKLESIRLKIDDLVIITKNHKISDQQSMKFFKENIKKNFITLKEETQQLIERSHSNSSLPIFFKDDLKNLKNMIDKEISAINTLRDLLEQSDPDTAIYNEYLNFLQYPSNNDIFTVHMRYNALSKEFNATYTSSKSREMQTKIKNLKDLYNEKMESLCHIKIQSIKNSIDNITTTTKNNYKILDHQTITVSKQRIAYKQEIEESLKRLMTLKSDCQELIEKNKYYPNSYSLCPIIRIFVNNIDGILDTIEEKISWICKIKKILDTQQKNIDNIDEINKIKEKTCYLLNNDETREQIKLALEMIQERAINYHKLYSLLLEHLSKQYCLGLEEQELENMQELSSLIAKLSLAINKDVNGYRLTERVIKYFKQINTYFEEEENAINRRIDKRELYSQTQLGNDLALLAEKAQTYESIYQTKLNNLFKLLSDIISNIPPSWNNLLIQWKQTCSKMNALKERCHIQKNKLEEEYDQKAPNILPALYQEIEKNSKKLQSDINKIQPGDAISLMDYRLLKTRAAEMDSKIHYFIKMVNHFNKKLPQNNIFKSNGYSITLEQLANRASAWGLQSRSLNPFIFFSNKLEAKFNTLKKKPLEIYEDFTFSNIKVHMAHLQKKVIGLEIPEIGDIDLKKTYGKIYAQCADLIPKEIADDNQVLNLDKPQSSHRPSVIDNFNEDLERLVKMTPLNFQSNDTYILHLERKKLLTHIALAFESRKKDIEKIKNSTEKEKEFNNYRNDLTMAWLELATSTFHCIDRQINVPLSIYNAHAAQLQELPEEALSLDNQIARQLLLLRREIFENALSKIALSWSPEMGQNFNQHRADTERLVRKKLNSEFGLQYSANLFIGANYENYAEHSQIDVVRQECYRKYTPQAICEHIKTVIMDNRKERKNRNLNFDKIYEWFKKQYPDVELGPILTDDGDLKPQAICILLKDKKNLIETINGL